MCSVLERLVFLFYDCSFHTGGRRICVSRWWSIHLLIGWFKILLHIFAELRNVHGVGGNQLPGCFEFGSH